LGLFNDQQRVIAEFDLAQKSPLFIFAVAVQGNSLSRAGRGGTATNLRHNMRCAMPPPSSVRHLVLTLKDFDLAQGDPAARGRGKNTAQNP
jgi:hypothetical protein